MLKRFLAYYHPYRGLFILDFGCAVLSGLLELGFPMAVRSFVDTLLPGQDWGLIVLASAALLKLAAKPDEAVALLGREMQPAELSAADLNQKLAALQSDESQSR